MNFVSYAQNFEDVMLWRALKHVECGFYIDVGANHPLIDSVTRAFYDNGWSGINIEPLSLHHAEISSDRTRDINLQCAAGDKSGEIEMWEYDVRGWATASLDVVEQHRNNGYLGRSYKVRVFTLAEICAQHVSGEIHFLKIDVEGLEGLVLLGADFSRYRPWIVLVEATKPNTQDGVYYEWEHLLTDVGYTFCYFDGLNRFYVAQEHSELQEFFGYPPCVFDNFVKYEQVFLGLRLAQVEDKVRQSEDKVKQVEKTLENMYESRSWRWTQPLRDLGHFYRQSQDYAILLQKKMKTKFGWIFEGSVAWLTFSPRSRPRRVLKKILLKIKECIVSRPRLKSWITDFLNRVPALKARLKRIGSNEPSFSSWPYVDGQEHLSSQAKQIFADLKAAIDRQRKENA